MSTQIDIEMIMNELKMALDNRYKLFEDEISNSKTIEDIKLLKEKYDNDINILKNNFIIKLNEYKQNLNEYNEYSDLSEIIINF